jgi:hypothetical protein
MRQREHALKNVLSWERLRASEAKAGSAHTAHDQALVSPEGPGRRRDSERVGSVTFSKLLRGYLTNPSGFSVSGRSLSAHLDVRPASLPGYHSRSFQFALTKPKQTLRMPTAVLQMLAPKLGRGCSPMTAERLDNALSNLGPP